MFDRTQRNERYGNRGLTLVELMVALAIISLLAGIALPSVKRTLQGVARYPTVVAI